MLLLLLFSSQQVLHALHIIFLFFFLLFLILLFNPTESIEPPTSAEEMSPLMPPFCMSLRLFKNSCYSFVPSLMFVFLAEMFSFHAVAEVDYCLIDIYK